MKGKRQGRPAPREPACGANRRRCLAVLAPEPPAWTGRDVWPAL